MRNNNNFRNQNNQIQPDSNNENHHRIRKRDNDVTSNNRFKTRESVQCGAEVLFFLFCF